MTCQKIMENERDFFEKIFSKFSLWFREEIVQKKIKDKPRLDLDGFYSSEVLGEFFDINVGEVHKINKKMGGYFHVKLRDNKVLYKPSEIIICIQNNRKKFPKLYNKFKANGLFDIAQQEKI